MRILGVDPALTVTGVGAIDQHGRTLRVVKAGVIITSPRQAMPERLEMIYDEITAVIKAVRPEVLALEKVYVHAHHPTTAFILGQARGMICLAASQAGVEVAEVAATQVKRAIVGNGQASKEQVMRMVCCMLGIKSAPRYNDVSDALALALTYGKKRAV